MNYRRGHSRRYLAFFLVLCLSITTFLTASSLSQKNPAGKVRLSGQMSLNGPDTLAPVIRHRPAVTIEERNGEYELVENEKELGHFLEGFKEDAGFVYLSLLIGQALKLDIGVEKLKELIGRDLSHIDFTRFLWKHLYKDGKSFCLPYVRKDAAARGESEKAHLLRFYLPDGSDVRFPDKVSMKIGDIEIIMEDPVIPLPSGEDEGSEGLGADTAEPGLPKAFPSFAKPSGDLPVMVEITKVERKGAIMMADPTQENFILNAGVLQIDGKRLLFARRATVEVVPGKKKGDSGIRRSEIGLFMHDPERGEVSEIDREMILPDGEDIVALEDARVIERDGTIYVYLTAVKKDGSYYSAVLTHGTGSFIEKVRKKLHAPNANVNWEWTPPEKLITEGEYSGVDHKNFVPFGNPTVMDGNKYWFALYRPSNERRSSMRLAYSAEGLAGPWSDAGRYMKMDPKEGWLGASAYVAEMPAGNGHRWDFMLYHKATFRDPDKRTSKYYDIRMLVTDRNNPGHYYASEPILVPAEGFELRGWVPGAIYSCGAILTGHDPEAGLYSFDVYYSGSDTAVLFANIQLVLRDRSAPDPEEKGPSLVDPVEKARQEFRELRQAFGMIERSHSAKDFSGVRWNALSLSRKLDDWDVIGGQGFGVSEQVVSVIEELDRIQDMINDHQVNRYNTVRPEETYRLLNPPIRICSRYFDEISRIVGRKTDPVNAVRFFHPMPQKTFDGLMEEFRALRREFEELERHRSGAYRVEQRGEWNWSTPWDPDFRFDALANGASQLLEKMKFWRLQWRRYPFDPEKGEKKPVEAIASGARRIMRALEEMKSICGEFSRNGVGVAGDVQAAYYGLNKPFNEGRSAFFSAANRFEDMAARYSDENAGKDANERLVEKAGKGARDLVDTLKLRAFAAKKNEEKLIIALDYSWIPGIGDRGSEQRMAIQRLLAEIYRLRKDEKLDNIIIVRGRGAELAGNIMEKVRKEGVPLANVVALGDESAILSAAFNPLRGDDPEKSAFLVGVNPENLKENSFVDIVGMLGMAVKLAFGEKSAVDLPGVKGFRVRDRLWIFIPEARPLDFEQLKAVYESARQSMIAA